MAVLAQTYGSNDDSLLVVVVVLWVIFGLIGAAIGNSKNMGCAGFLLGLLLGPLGLIIIAVMSTQPKSKLDQIEARGGPQPAWHADPLGRFDARWWDGTRWTQHVGRVLADGTRQQFEDPL